MIRFVYNTVAFLALFMAAHFLMGPETAQDVALVFIAVSLIGLRAEFNVCPQESGCTTTGPREAQ